MELTLSGATVELIVDPGRHPSASAQETELQIFLHHQLITFQF